MRVTDLPEGRGTLGQEAKGTIFIPLLGIVVIEYWSLAAALNLIFSVVTFSS